jgi:hypothetical protein
VHRIRSSHRDRDVLGLHRPEAVVFVGAFLLQAEKLRLWVPDLELLVNVHKLRVERGTARGPRGEHSDTRGAFQKYVVMGIIGQTFAILRNTPYPNLYRCLYADT